MRGSYLNDPCRELRTGEPDDSPGIAAKLDTIIVLWRQPDTMVLWGIPYDMRPGQQPYDLWRARRDYVPPRYGHHGPGPINLDDWIWLGSPGWWGHLSREDQESVKAFLEKHKGDVPNGPAEWSRVEREPTVSIVVADCKCRPRETCAVCLAKASQWWDMFRNKTSVELAAEADQKTGRAQPIHPTGGYAHMGCRCKGCKP